MIQLGRPKAKTHKGMPMDKLMRLANEVEDIAEGGFVSAEALDELSADLGVPLEKIYAGLALCGAVQLKLETKLQITVCTGACQEYGALDCVSELLELREERLEEDQDAFDIVPRACLNRCQNAPVMELRTPDGTAVLADATPKLVRGTMGELLEG